MGIYDFQNEMISFSVNPRLGIKSMKSDTAVFAGRCSIQSQKLLKECCNQQIKRKCMQWNKFFCLFLIRCGLHAARPVLITQQLSHCAVKHCVDISGLLWFTLPLLVTWGSLEVNLLWCCKPLFLQGPGISCLLQPGSVSWSVTGGGSRETGQRSGRSSSRDSTMTNQTSGSLWASRTTWM